jgi:hypothetical protein
MGWVRYVMLFAKVLYVARIERMKWCEEMLDATKLVVGQERVFVVFPREA